MSGDEEEWSEEDLAEIAKASKELETATAEMVFSSKIQLEQTGDAIITAMCEWSGKYRHFFLKLLRKQVDVYELDPDGDMLEGKKPSPRKGEKKPDGFLWYRGRYKNADKAFTALSEALEASEEDFDDED